MENPLCVSPVPTTATHSCSSSLSKSSGLRRSPTSWTLSSMTQMLADQEAHSDTDSDDASDDASDRANDSDADTLDDTSVSSAICTAKRSVSMAMRKPPRHSSVPMCAQILLSLWQRTLQRSDVSISSDFFYDLGGSNEQAFEIVDRMQRMGFRISLQQFVALRRCSIYSVLLVAL